MLSTKLLIRLASRLQATWRRNHPPDPDDGEWQSVEAQLSRLQSARQRWRLTHDHNLNLIRPVIQLDVHSALIVVLRHVERLRAQFSESKVNDPDPPFTLSHWFAELCQLDNEFDDLEVDWKAHTLKITTDFISLKDVPLGRFSVVFAWSRVGTMAGRRCFDLIALDPNPARGKEGVTHPHVRHEELCVGDAAQPLDDAIRDGRLADAFLLIRSVLTTYNPRSPYVSLEEWDGTTCGECGSSTDCDEPRTCDACHCDLCEECLSCCGGCSDSRCPSCVFRCESCHDSYCGGCLETIDDKSLCSECIGSCVDCSSRFPKTELSDDQRCPSCLIPETNDDDPDEFVHSQPVPSERQTLPQFPPTRSSIALEVRSPHELATYE